MIPFSLAWTANNILEEYNREPSTFKEYEEKNMSETDHNFEQFNYDPTRSHCHKHFDGLTIRVSGHIGLGAKLFTDNDLNNHNYCHLYYDKQHDLILVKFLQEYEAGASAISESKKKAGTDRCINHKMFALKYNLFGNRYQLVKKIRSPDTAFLFERKKENND